MAYYFSILDIIIVTLLCCRSSGRAWRSPSASCRHSGGADPTALAAPRPPRLPCTPATWTRTQDQVWGDDASSFLFPVCSLSFCSRDMCNVIQNVSDGRRFRPTSPLRDYTDASRRRRRSRTRSHSACVRFKDAGATEEDVRKSKPGSDSLPLASVVLSAGGRWTHRLSSMLTSSFLPHFCLFKKPALTVWSFSKWTNCLLNLQWLCHLFHLDSHCASVPEGPALWSAETVSRTRYRNSQEEQVVTNGHNPKKTDTNNLVFWSARKLKHYTCITLMQWWDVAIFSVVFFFSMFFSPRDAARWTCSFKLTQFKFWEVKNSLPHLPLDAKC